MHGKRTLSLPAAAVVGAVVGVAIVWLNRPAPPSCTTLDNGMRACMPIYVVEPPLWLYAAFAVCGALLAGAVTFTFTCLARSR